MDIYSELEQRVRDKMQLSQDEKIFVFFTDEYGVMLTKPQENSLKKVFIGYNLYSWEEIFNDE